MNTTYCLPICIGTAHQSIKAPSAADGRHRVHNHSYTAPSAASAEQLLACNLVYALIPRATIIFARGAPRSSLAADLTPSVRPSSRTRANPAPLDGSRRGLEMEQYTITPKWRPSAAWVAAERPQQQRAQRKACTSRHAGTPATPAGAAQQIRWPWPSAARRPSPAPASAAAAPGAAAAARAALPARPQASAAARARHWRRRSSQPPAAPPPLQPR
jgi:hypothetical protein